MPPLVLPAIKNKRKREQVFLKAKKEKRQAKLQRRLATAKREADDPIAKQVCAFSLYSQPERLSQTCTYCRRNDWRRMSRAHSKTLANPTRPF